MNGLGLQVGGFEQYVYFLIAELTNELRINVRCRLSLVVNVDGRCEEQIDIAALGAVVHARAKKRDMCTLAQHSLRSVFDGVDLLFCQAHV